MSNILGIVRVNNGLNGNYKPSSVFEHLQTIIHKCAWFQFYEKYKWNNFQKFVLHRIEYFSQSINYIYNNQSITPEMNAIKIHFEINDGLSCYIYDYTRFGGEIIQFRYSTKNDALRNELIDFIGFICNHGWAINVDSDDEINIHYTGVNA